MRQISTSPAAGRQERIVDAWNLAKDDLGSLERRQARGRSLNQEHPPHATILHFVRHIDRLSHQTMGEHVSNWDEAVRAMPRIRFGGREIAVHPRALYFASVAQMRMDVRSGIAEGAGHYVLPGLYRDELTIIASTAQALARRRQPNAQDLNTYRALRSGLHRMNREMRRRAETANHGEHVDEAMDQWFQERAHAIDNLPERPSEAGLTLAASSMAHLLDPIPEGRTHGAGSVDPHGTDHALGNAFDIANGAGAAGHVNMAMRPEFWPFVAEVLDQYGEPHGLHGLRPRNLMEHGAETAREIARLLSQHGSDVAEDIRSREARAPTPLAPEVQQAMSRLRAAMRVHAAQMQRDSLHFDEPLRSALQRAAAHLRDDQSQSRQQDPYWLLQSLEVRRFPELYVLHARALTERLPNPHGLRDLSADVETRVAAARESSRDQLRRHQQRGVSRAESNDLSEQMAAHGILPQQPHNASVGSLQAAHDALKALVGPPPSPPRPVSPQLQRVVNTAAFRRWLEVVRDQPVYDQPQVLIDAIADVRGHEDGDSHFGEHHWQVVDHEVLHGGTSYRSALRRDMAERSVEDMARILRIVAESAGGSAVLQQQDFLVELRSWAATRGIDVDTMISHAIEASTNQ